MMERSGLFKLNWRDIVHGFIMAVAGSLVGSAMQILNSGLVFTWDIWQPAVAGAVVAGLAYLMKSLFSNQNGEVLKQ